MTYPKITLKKHMVTVAMVATLMSGSAMAQGPFGHRSAPHSRMEIMIEKLGLNDNQIAQIETLLESRGASMPDKTNRKMEIKALIDQGNIIQAADLAAESARTEVYRMAEFENAMSQILTPEQLATRQEMQQRNQKRMERRMERRVNQFNG